MTKLDSKIPEGPLAEKWTNFKAHQNLVNPAINLQIDRNPIKPEILCQYCDCSKALKELGWQSKTTIEEGVIRIIK